VSSFTRPQLAGCFHQWFAPNNMILTAAGHIEHRRLMELAAAAFGHLPPAQNGFKDSAPVPQPRITLKSKHALEQVHICLGVPSYPMVHDRRYAIAVLNNLLGGGMSSRLFQNIRERQGLAYAVFSELSPYRDAGVLSIYAGTAIETAGQVVRSITSEFASLKQQLVSEEELRRAKDHLKGSLMLSLESTSARMSNLARQEIYFARFFTLDEIIASIEAVSREEVRDIAREFFQPEHISVTVLGNLDGFQLTRDHLAC
jgi:predicted Zn-dependent peptidase